MDIGCIDRTDLGDFRFESRNNWRAIQLPTRSKNEAILRIEADHRDFRMQIAVNELENPFQNAGIKEKGGSEVEAEPVVFEGRTAAANARQPFHHMHAHACFCQQKRGSKPSGSSPYNHYFFGSLASGEVWRLSSSFAAGKR
jgi:hypothetical protein